MDLGGGKWVNLLLLGLLGELLFEVIKEIRVKILPAQVCTFRLSVYIQV